MQEERYYCRHCRAAVYAFWEYASPPPGAPLLRVRIQHGENPEHSLLEESPDGSWDESDGEPAREPDVVLSIYTTVLGERRVASGPWFEQLHERIARALPQQGPQETR